MDRTGQDQGQRQKDTDENEPKPHETNRRKRGPFKSMKVKPKAKPGRGALDAGVIFDVLKESWDELQDALEEIGEEEQQAVKDYFNQLVDGENDLGESLFGDDYKDFEARINLLDDHKA